MKTKFLTPIIIFLLTAVSVVAVGISIFVYNIQQIQPVPIVNVPIVNSPAVNGQPGMIGCTKEAKQCHDGSYVGRSGPNCEFATCPAIKSTAGQLCSGTGDLGCGRGYQCIQDCGAPVARDTDPIPPYHCMVDALANQPRNCPICLASNVLINTPSGAVPVTQITKGMKVWSVDSNGKKVSSSIIEVIKTPVPETHQVVHLIMADKREVWVSANHPLVNGLTVGSLKVGDVYDGSNVKVAELVQYWDDFTYDILPDSDTGEYWANGVFMGSTLLKK